MAINVLSLFDGISCGRLAVERSGIKVDKYYASEIDKFSLAVSSHNYPDNIQLGDVSEWREWDLPQIDLLIGGSPCQGFSVAGNQLAFDDPRSKLFFEFVDVLKHCNPRYFLLENVRMKKEWQDIISSFLGVEPILINSNLVSAQNRKRLYWTNIPNITQPKDKGIKLSDILLEDGIGIIKNHGSLEIRHEKSMCLDANYFKGVDNHGQRTMIMQYIEDGYRGVAFTERRTEEAKKIRREYRKLYGKDFSPRRSKEMVPRTDDKMNCLTAAYSIKEHTLIDNDGTYRKLYPVECERLQTVPCGHTFLGLDTHFQICSNYGNESYFKRSGSCRESVKSKVVVNQSQIKKVSCAISTILELLETEQPNLKENLSIKTKSVSLKDVEKPNKLLSVIALSTINLGKDSRMQSIKNVKFVIERLVTQGGEGCVFVMQLLRQDGEILYELKKIQLGNTNHMEMMVEDIIKQKMEDGFIELLQKKYLEESCTMEKSYIILILINLIIARAIFMSVKTTRHTYLSIGSLNLLQENSLGMELSSLEMDNIIEISNSTRYKQLGNGWTIDVISHILSHIPGGQNAK